VSGEGSEPGPVVPAAGEPVDDPVEAAEQDLRPEPEPTGDPAVDEAMASLAAAAGEPLEHQLAVFDAVHRTLQDRLADVEG
jgi:hypothetical protein